MPRFNDLYLSKESISSTYLPFPIAGQKVTEDGRTKNTPLLEVKNLMVDTIRTTFAELEATGKFNCRLMPSTVFGKYENGTNKYDEVGRFISRDVIDFLNDQYGEYKTRGFENMFNILFYTPIKIDGEVGYLRIFSKGKDNVIYKRTHDKIIQLFEQANYKIPFTGSQREQFKAIFRDAYFSLIEGVISKQNGHALTNNGEHIIEKKSDLQIALAMIRKNQKFSLDDFNTVEGFNNNNYRY